LIGPIGDCNKFLTATLSNEMIAWILFIGTIDDFEVAARKRGALECLNILPGIRSIMAERRRARGMRPSADEEACD